LSALGYRGPSLGDIETRMRSGYSAAEWVRSDATSVDLHWALCDEIFLDKNALVWAHVRPPAGVGRLPGLRLSPELALVQMADALPSPRFRQGERARRFLCHGHTAGGSHRSGAGGVARAQARHHRCRRSSGAPVWPAFRPASGDRAAAAAGRFAARAPRHDAARAPGTAAHARRTYLGLAQGTRRWLLAGSYLPREEGFRRLYLPTPAELADRFGRPYAPTMYASYYRRQILRVLTRSRKAFRESRF
jgi:hypothetical protein